MTLNKKLFLLILVCSSLLLLIGLNSHLYLGDEVFHYRFAKDIYREGKRVAFDPLYESGQPPGYYYIAAPFWHFALVSIWEVMGRISFPIAQIYHTGYYVALILLTFLLGETLYNKKIGLVSSFIVATVPMVVSFSIIFYMDIPACAFTVLFLLLFFKEHYWWAGLCIGLMYLTKRNACFLIPIIPLMIIFKYKKNLFRSIGTCIRMFIPASAIILWDVLWRINNISSFYKQPNFHTGMTWKEMIANLGLDSSFIVDFVETNKQFISKNSGNSVLLNPTDVVKYLGVAFLILMFLYFIKRRFEKKDFWLWAPIVSYIIFYVFFFGLNSDIRYLSPVIPLLCIFISKAFISIKNSSLKKFIIGLCIIQLVSTCIYVYSKRQLSEEEKQAFQYVKENIPDNCLIMYPEFMLLEQTDKTFVWGTCYFWPYFFWGDEKDKKVVIERNDLHYIIIKRTRVYDDSQTRHLGGYPKSFIEELPTLPFVNCIYKNSVISIWKIDRRLTKLAQVKSNNEN